MRIARGISIVNISKPISTVIVYDVDAVAFFTAASITDTTQKSAVNQLVLDLKSANIWTKMKALYPVVGGVASSHAVNLKQPGTFNLSFATGWTHSSTGMTPNGATYADTNLTPSNALSLNSTHFSIYSRTDGAGGSGGWDSGLNGIMIYSDTTQFAIRANDSTYTSKTPIGNTSKGLFISNRISSTTKKLIQNTSISNYSVNSTVLNNIILYLSAVNSNGATVSYDNKQCAFASIGNGLTDAEASSFYNAVQTFQTTLNRQIP